MKMVPSLATKWTANVGLGDVDVESSFALISATLIQLGFDIQHLHEFLVGKGETKLMDGVNREVLEDLLEDGEVEYAMCIVYLNTTDRDNTLQLLREIKENKEWMIQHIRD